MNWEQDGQASTRWPLPKFYFQVQVAIESLEITHEGIMIENG